MRKRTYDNYYLEKMQVFFERTKLQSYELLNATKKDTIVDMGCGIGLDVINLAKSGANIIGIDHDPTFIELAKNLAGKNEHVKFVCASASNIPLENNSVTKIRFDRILQHLENHNEIICEANRILVSGGQIQIIDADYLSWTLFLEDEKLERKIFDTFAYERFKGAKLLRKLPKLLEKNNFEVTSYEVHNYQITDFDFANYIIKLNKFVNEGLENGTISKSEFLAWEQQNKKYFNLSINLLIINAKKI